MPDNPQSTQIDRNQPFRLLEPLGSGAFAHTYRARVLDPDLVEDFGAEEVALKIPLSRKKERVLRRELMMNVSLHLHLKEMQSVNIVKYLGFDVYDGRIVMAMEYVAGGSLRGKIGVIGRQRPLPVEEAVQITRGILQGLTVIHSGHLLHRDIKPENVLIGEQGPKIADLGISRLLESNELASTTAGTLPYMSPEILDESGATFSTDIWSVGVTFYEMLAGRLPFGDNTTPPGRLIDLIRRCDFVPVPQIRPDVPAALAEVVARSLSKAAETRYQTAHEMLEALQRFEESKADRALEAAMAPARDLMERGGDSREIETILRGVVRQFRDNVRAHQYLGEYYNRCQRYSEAIEAFNAGLSVDSNCAMLYWNLGLANHNIGNRVQARQHIEKAIDLGLDPSLRRHAKLLLRTLQ